MTRREILENNPIPFGYRISYLANFFTGSVYRDVTSRLGVARSEFVVVFCVRVLGELSAQDICDITGRPKNSISRAVNAMVDGGYITRRVDPTDARRAVLALTRAGAALYEAAMPLFVERESAMLAPLSAAERRTLDALLAKLVLRDDDWAGSVGSGD